ncbi:MAG: addiction module protein [Candidatus Aminicenantes bacterium]|nr:MAG: addiction module protein [Candidatus Aminicenantes bacterium]
MSDKFISNKRKSNQPLNAGLTRCLDEPNKEIDAIWAEEAQKRLRAHREGKTKGVPFEDVFEEAP